MLPRTIIWRLKHRTLGVAECVIRDRHDGRSSLCVTGSEDPSIEVFEGLVPAMQRAIQIEGALRDEGWREVSPELPALPTRRPRRPNHAGLRLVSRRAELFDSYRAEL